MTLSPDLTAEILRLAFNEEWPIGTIARQMGVHRDVVIRIISAKEEKLTDSKKNGTLVEPFLPFILETLTKYPDIHASRVFAMIRKRGYPGTSSGHFRRIVAGLRPKKQQEAFVRLATLSGEQAQVDWAEFGKIEVAGGERKLLAFIMTLSWSRSVFVKFYLAGQMVEFQHGFMAAFDFFGGVPRIIIHDNLKSGVLERAGSLIRFNPRFMEFASHYRFEPRAAGVRKGNQKGRVERAVRYIRDNFYAGRGWKNLIDLNKQALEWCTEESLDRLWKAGDPRTVRECFTSEKLDLLPIPDARFASYDKTPVRIGKVPYARYDTCDYSVPMEYAGKTLFIVADTERIRILNDEQKCVAEYERSYGKAQTFTNSEHTKAILAHKKRAQTPAGLRRLIDSVPQCEFFVEELAKRGEKIGGSVTSLLKMLDTYGKVVLAAAIAEVMQSGRIQLRSVHFVLKRLVKDFQGENLSNSVVVPRHLDLISVSEHDLSTYDIIAEIK